MNKIWVAIEWESNQPAPPITCPRITVIDGSNERRNSGIFIPKKSRGRDTGVDKFEAIPRWSWAGAAYCVATLGGMDTKVHTLVLLDRGLDERGGKARRGGEGRVENIMQARILAARLNICRQVARLGHAPWLEPFVHPRAST